MTRLADTDQSASFFGYVNAVSSVFSLQLGPALASATMTALLWLPLWLGIAILLLAVPVISALPLPAAAHSSSNSSIPPRSRSPADEEAHTAAAMTASATEPPETDATPENAPLIPNTPPPYPRDAGAPYSWRVHTTHRLRSLLALLTNPTRNLTLLFTVFFLASLASSDTKLLPLYMSKRYGWRFADVGYLLSAKAVWNFGWLVVVVPRVLKWRRRRGMVSLGVGGVDGLNVVHAHVCLVVSVLGAAAIGVSPTVWVLVPALLVYALGIALPMFTYSLLRAPSMMAAGGLGAGGAGGDGDGDGEGHAAQLFSVVMLVRTVGTLAGSIVMPGLWVTGMGIGGWALGLPYVASAMCYAAAGVVVKKIVV